MYSLCTRARTSASTITSTSNRTGTTIGTSTRPIIGTRDRIRTLIITRIGAITAVTRLRVRVYALGLVILT